MLTYKQFFELSPSSLALSGNGKRLSNRFKTGQEYGGYLTARRMCHMANKPYPIGAGKSGQDIRTIPPWTLKGNLRVCPEDQLPGSMSRLELGSGPAKIYNPWSKPCSMDEEGYCWSYGDLCRRLRSAVTRTGTSVCFFPGIESINSLLAQTEKFPEEWKEFELQLWGTIFRSNPGYPCIKTLYHDHENEVWLVGHRALVGDEMDDRTPSEVSIENNITEIIRSSGPYVRVLYI